MAVQKVERSGTRGDEQGGMQSQAGALEQDREQDRGRSKSRSRGRGRSRVASLLIWTVGLVACAPAALSSPQAETWRSSAGAVLAPGADEKRAAALGSGGEFASVVAVGAGSDRGLAAVAAPRAVVDGERRGRVRFFAQVEGQDGDDPGWQTTDAAIVDGAALLAGARVGASLAIERGLVVVGVPGASSGGGDVGASGLVRIYDARSARRAALGSTTGSASAPLLLAELGSLPFDPGAAFGAAVALGADGGVERLAVGAPSSRASGVAFSGAVHVFERRGDGWVRDAVLVSPHPTVAASFGSALAWAGSTLAVGAPGDGLMAPGAGAVFGFDFAPGQGGALAWERRFEGGSASGARFGESVVSVGLGQFAAGARGRGAVEVWSVSGAGVGIVQRLEGDAAAGFGTRLGGRGGRLIVAEPFAAGGRVVPFRQSAGGWQRGAVLAPPDPEGAGEFGVALAVGATLDGLPCFAIGDPLAAQDCGEGGRGGDLRLLRSAQGSTRSSTQGSLLCRAGAAHVFTRRDRSVEPTW